MDSSHTSKKPKLDQSAELLNVPSKDLLHVMGVVFGDLFTFAKALPSALPSVLILNNKSPHIYRVGESKCKLCICINDI